VTPPLAAADPNAVPLAVALGIGLLLGVERERHKGTGAARGPAGIRTFALVGLLGGLAQVVGGAAVTAVAGGFVALASVAAYLRSREEDPGLTTEVALMVTFLLGALAQEETELAVGIGVAVALVLTFRERLHRLARDTLSEDEVHDGLLFAAAALIVLPLMPDEGLGPNEALNPFTVWRLVVIVMSIQAMGYVALRLIGPRYGLLVSGFISGFVSSAATVGTMGSRAREAPELRRPAVGAAVVSTVATIVLLALVVAATSLDTLLALALPLTLAGIAAGGYAALVAWRAVRHVPENVDPGRAFDLKTAVILALTVSAVLLVAGVLNEELGQRGVILGAGVAGFADSQSAAISAAALVAAGQLSASDAVIPVLAALSTNTVTKAVLAFWLGDRRYGIDVGVGLVLMIGAAWAGYVIAQALS
jgi:uncharacterized membrane protein (DUF4010 family)